MAVGKETAGWVQATALPRCSFLRRKVASSCRRHDMDPHLYFMQLLVNLPTWLARDLDAWLPDRWKQAHITRCAALGIPVPPSP